MPHDTGSKYEKAVRDVVSAVQILIYRRESVPIRDREEVQTDIERRSQELQKRMANGKSNWRRGLLEMAAYCIFAACSDEE